MAMTKSRPPLQWIPNPITFFLLSLAAWWDRKVWQMQRYDAERYFWSPAAKSLVWVNARPWGDGWRPAWYL